MKIKLFLIAVVSCFVAHSLVGQDYVRIPSPQTWDFKSYGNVPISMYAGRLDLQIPLYHYQDKDFDIPIGLGYNAVGFSPNKPAGPIGLNWFLSYGGAITRQVVGAPDDMTYQGHGGDELDSGELHGLLLGIRSGYHQEVTNSKVFSLAVGIMFPGTAGLWTLTAGHFNRKCEVTPDIFSFNFLGYSGKFMIGYDGNVQVWGCLGSGAIKVDISSVALQKNVNNLKPKKSEIRITTGDGYTYYFGGELSSLEYSHNVAGIPELEAEVVSSPYVDMLSTNIDAWYLSKIVAPNGRTVTYEYMEQPDIPVDALSTPYSIPFPVGCYIANASSTKYVEHVYKEFEAKFLLKVIGQGHSRESGEHTSMKMELTKSALIKEIKIDGGASIVFGYSEKEKPDIYDQHEILNMLIPKSYKLGSIQVYNQHKQGLKKVDFLYKYGGRSDEKRRLFLEKVSLSDIGTYEFFYDLYLPLPASISYGTDHWGFYNRYEGLSSLLWDLEITSAGDIISIDPRFNHIRDANKYCLLTLLNKVKYPTGGYTEIEYELHDYSYRLDRNSSHSFWPTLYPLEGKAGGARVKSITDVDDVNGARRTRAFEYRAYGSQQSSGVLLSWPIYGSALFSKYNWSSIFGIGNGNVKQTTYRISKDAISINASDSEYITYEAVVERLEDGSCTEYKFSTYRTNPDDGKDKQGVGKTNISDDIFQPYPFWSNIHRQPNSRSEERGKLLSKTVYDSEGNKVSVDSIKYTAGEERFIATVGGSANTVITRKNYTYSYLPYEEKNYLYGTNKSQPPVVKTTRYAYNSLWLEKERAVSQSDGSHLVSRTRYPHEIGIPQETGIAEGKAINEMSRSMMATPIETTTYLKEANGQEKFLSAELTMYKRSELNGVPLPIVVYKLLASETVKSYAPLSFDKYFFKLTLDPNLQSEVQFDSYDSYNNLQQFTTRNGTPNSYLWGYGQVYPIAHISGASYQEVEAVLQGNQLNQLNRYRTTEQLAPVVKALQSSLPHAHTKGYSYIPQVGISTEWGVDGIETRYRYDIHGRLTKIIDHNKNIVRQLKYHVKDENDLLTEELEEVAYVNPSDLQPANTYRCQKDKNELNTGYKEWLFIDPNNPKQEVWKVLDKEYSSDCLASYWLTEEWIYGSDIQYKAHRTHNDGRNPTFVIIGKFYPEDGTEPYTFKEVRTNVFMTTPNGVNVNIIDIMLTPMPGRSVVEKTYILFHTVSESDKTGYWVPTGAYQCAEDILGPTGYLKFEEEDQNPYSNSFEKTRWVEDTSRRYPERCPARYGQSVKTTTGKLFVIEATRSYNDGRPATYRATVSYTSKQGLPGSCTHNLIFPQTANLKHTFTLDYRGYTTASITKIDVVYEELPASSCDPSANWVIIGGSQCAKNGGGNSGYLEYWSEDKNPGSITYGNREWVADVLTPKRSECPADYVSTLVDNKNGQMVIKVTRSYNDNRQATLLPTVTYTPKSQNLAPDTRTYNFPLAFNANNEAIVTLSYSPNGSAVLNAEQGKVDIVYENRPATNINTLESWIKIDSSCKCEKESPSSSINTGYLTCTQINANPHNLGYGSTRQHVDKSQRSQECGASYWHESTTDFDNWFDFVIARNFDDGKGNISLKVTYSLEPRSSNPNLSGSRDVAMLTPDNPYWYGDRKTFLLAHPDPATYKMTVEGVEIIHGPVIPDTSPWWRSTNNSKCNTVNGLYTGYIEYEEVDMNPNSSSKGAKRWYVDSSKKNTASCPAMYYYEVKQLDGSDAFIEFKRSYYDGTNISYEIDVRVYEMDDFKNIIGVYDDKLYFSKVFQGSELSRTEYRMMINIRGTADIQASRSTIHK